MDNPNDPNLSNNPNPIQPVVGTPTPAQDFPISPPVPPEVPPQSMPQSSSPYDIPVAPTPPSPPNLPPIPDLTPPWAPPQSTNPTAEPFSNPTPTPWNPTPPLDQPASGQSEPNVSPLDNPWNAPIQPPPFAGGVPQNPQTYPSEPSLPSSPPQSAWEPNQPTPEPTSAAPTESIPTDLSHLISNDSQLENPQNPAPETLVVPPASNAVPDVPTLPLDSHKGIPKWLIGVGVGLLIIVAAASAYFILGFGQTPKTTTSIPAQTTNTSQVKPPAPVATPVQTTQAPATGSASFGSLEGSGTPQATRAGDLMKKGK